MDINKNLCMVFVRHKKNITIEKSKLLEYQKSDNNLEIIKELDENSLMIKVHVLDYGTGFFVKYLESYYIVTVHHVLQYFDIKNSYICIFNEHNEPKEILISEIIENEKEVKTHPIHDIGRIKLLDEKLSKLEGIKFLEFPNQMELINKNCNTNSIGFLSFPDENKDCRPTILDAKILYLYKEYSYETYKTDLIWLDKPTVLGYSGGPVINKDNNKVIGITSGSFYKDNKNNLLNSLVVPIKYLFELF